MGLAGISHEELAVMMGELRADSAFDDVAGSLFVICHLQRAKHPSVDLLTAELAGKLDPCCLSALRRLIDLPGERSYRYPPQRRPAHSRQEDSVGHGLPQEGQIDRHELQQQHRRNGSVAVRTFAPATWAPARLG